LIRPWYRRWGATNEELDRAFPGDDLVPEPRLETTRGVTIHASADLIWPWLVQMGQGRGGLYSYDGLENLVGCDIHSADRIIPEYQYPVVGDKLRLGPEGYPFFTIVGVEPDRALVLRSGTDDQQETSAVSSWVFFLDERKDRNTRLIARQRNAYGSGLGNLLIWRVFTDPISFVMERRMLLGIKERVEAMAER
jgi:hypothetical protein